jgi:cation diffusion facilitator CzcD-associated flavoprotein CzcO
MSRPDHNNRIAIVGGGPAGLVAATSLLEENLQPVLFAQSSAIGGQWHGSAILLQSLHGLPAGR